MEENNLKHIAIIMDGNRRWAKQRNLDPRLGHKKGAETLENIVKYANKIGTQEIEVSDAVSTINIEDIESGVYFISVKQNDNNFVEKLVVK